MNLQNSKPSVEFNYLQSMGSEHSSGSVSHQTSAVIFKDSDREVFDLCSLEETTSICSGLYLGSRFDEIPNIGASKAPEECVKSSINTIDTTDFQTTISCKTAMVSTMVSLEVLVPSLSSAQPHSFTVSPSSKSISAHASKTTITQPPTPPPFKTGRPTYAEQRSPVVPAHIAVRRLALGCGSVGPTQQDEVLDLCLALLDRACILRHIPARKWNGTSEKMLPTNEKLDKEYLNKIDLWMNASSEKRHDRTAEVLRVCLEGCSICVSRASAQPIEKRVRLTERLVVGSFLPLIEESLAVRPEMIRTFCAVPCVREIRTNDAVQVGIEDMLRPGSLFPQVLTRPTFPARARTSYTYQITVKGQPQTQGKILTAGPAGRLTRHGRRSSL
jgi:hypothetical protein